MSEEFTYRGKRFRVRIEADESAEAPWQAEDGHGPVSDWRSINWRGFIPTAPGERVLYRPRYGAARVYDMAEACRIARRDRWGFGGKSAAEHMASGLTARQVAAKAAEADYWRLRRWCEDDWHYVGVIVERLGRSGDVMETASLWGIESDADDYLKTVKFDLADELLPRRRPRAKAAETAARV